MSARMSWVRSSWAVHPFPIISVLLLLCTSALGGAGATAVVVGIVLCDKCRDGRRSLFDSPVPGAKVAVTCDDPSGNKPSFVEVKTTWLGSYTVHLKGEPDLTRCSARITYVPSWCASSPSADEAEGPAQQPSQSLNLVFRVFGKELYTVPPLLSRPSGRRGGTCTRNPPPLPPPPPTHMESPDPPPVDEEDPEPQAPPTIPLTPPTETHTEATATGGGWASPAQHVVRREPHHVRRLPKHHVLRRSFACPFDKWMSPEYTCRWEVLDPDTTVAAAFGPIAARHYGSNATVWEGLFRKGEPYGALLREATASLLNAYAAGPGGFIFSPATVVHKTNAALLGTPRQVASAAIKFRRANSGDRKFGGGKCGLRPCSRASKPKP